MPPHLLVTLEALPAPQADERVESETGCVRHTCVVKHRLRRIYRSGEWLKRRRERELLIECVEEAVKGLKQ